MNLAQLNALVAVEDHRTFTAAAHALHTVQSNVSSHVGHLERELGVVLVNRATSELTSEGVVVARRARRVIAECASITIDLSSAGQPRGPSRIGMIGTAARWLAPDLLGELTAGYPHIHLVVSEGTSTALAEHLGSARIDAAILHGAVRATEPLELVPLFDEDLLLVLPPSFLFPARTTIGVRDLAALDLILPPPGTAYRPELDAAASAEGVELHAGAEFDGVRLIASLTFDGHGPSILPATAIPSWVRDRCRILPVDGLPPRRIAVAHLARAQPSAATQAVLGVVTRLVARRGNRDQLIRPCVTPREIAPTTPAETATILRDTCPSERHRQRPQTSCEDQQRTVSPS